MLRTRFRRAGTGQGAASSDARRSGLAAFLGRSPKDWAERDLRVISWLWPRAAQRAYADGYLGNALSAQLLRSSNE